MSEGLTQVDIRAIRDGGREHITKLYAQFAALERLLAEGRIKRVRGGYQIGDRAAYEQVRLLINGISMAAGGRTGTVKLIKRTKRLDAIAKRFGVDVRSD